MSYLKKGLIWGLKYGIPIGVAINFTIILVYSGIYGTSYLSFPYLLKNYIASVAVGFVCSGLPVVYSIKKWSLLKQTTMHVVSMLCVYLPCSIYAGWVSVKPISLVVFIVIFIAVYICYWLVWYFYWKLKVKKINEAIKNKN